MTEIFACFFHLLLLWWPQQVSVLSCSSSSSAGFLPVCIVCAEKCRGRPLRWVNVNISSDSLCIDQTLAGLRGALGIILLNDRADFFSSADMFEQHA